MPNQGQPPLGSTVCSAINRLGIPRPTEAHNT